MSKLVFCLLACGFMLAPAFVLAQEPIIYPTKNQSAEQQSKDQSECQSWANNESGFDPANPHAGAPPQAEQHTSGRPVVRSAARGALVGAAAGSIVGDTSDAKKGAAAGAAVGGLRAGFKKRDAQKANAQAAEAEEARTQENQANFNRAFEACMTGRGYSVK